MNKLLKLWIAGAAVTTMAGCSSMLEKEKEKETPDVVPVEVQSLTYGVSHFDDNRSFVIYESGYEHVVLPSGRSVMYRKGWDTQTLAQMAAALDKDGDRTELTKQASRPAGTTTKQAGDRETYTDPIELAWAKLCSNKIDEMTDGDWLIITTTDMPDSLKSWCDENTAKHHIK